MRKAESYPSGGHSPPQSLHTLPGMWLIILPPKHLPSQQPMPPRPARLVLQRLRAVDLPRARFLSSARRSGITQHIEGSVCSWLRLPGDTDDSTGMEAELREERGH